MCRQASILPETLFIYFVFCHFKQIIIWQVMWIVAILRCAVGIKESETEM